MASYFAKIAWSMRLIEVAMVSVLFAGALVTSSLALTAAALLGGGGDLSTLVTVAVIAMACTVVVLRAVTRHGVSERWVLARKLRMVGMSTRSLRIALLVEVAMLATFASVLASFAAWLVVAPVIRPYLVQIGVIAADVHVGWNTSAAAITVVVTVVVGVLGALSGVRILTSTEPAIAEPLSPRTGSRNMPRMIVLLLAIACTILLASQISASTSDSVAFLLGILACIAAIVVACTVWNPVLLLAGWIRRRLPTQTGATVIVTSRWRAYGYQTTLVLATSVATMLCVYLGSYPSLADAAARERLSTILEGQLVAEPSEEVSPAQAAELLRDSPGVVLVQVEAVVERGGRSNDSEESSWTSPITLVGGLDSQQWPTRLGVQKPIDGQHSVIMTAQASSQSGIVTDDSLAIYAPTLPAEQRFVLGITSMPDTFGSYLVFDSNGVFVDLTAGAVVLLLQDVADVPAGWKAIGADQWTAGLPPGKAVSNSGGSGSLETPLLVGAPLALCLTLAAASAAATTTSRGPDRRILRIIGMTRTQRSRTILRPLTVDTLIIGALCLVVALSLLRLAIIPYAHIIGTSPPTLTAIPTWMFLLPVICWIASVVGMAISLASESRQD